jgi:hypothetical protein
MNRDDIIRMAIQAGAEQKMHGYWSFLQDDIERFAELVAAAEREACAKAVEGYCGAWDDQGYALTQIIRTRGEK